MATQQDMNRAAKEASTSISSQLEDLTKEVKALQAAAAVVQDAAASRGDAAPTPPAKRAKPVCSGSFVSDSLLMYTQSTPPDPWEELSTNLLAVEGIWSGDAPEREVLMRLLEHFKQEGWQPSDFRTSKLVTAELEEAIASPAPEKRKGIAIAYWKKLSSAVKEIAGKK